MIQKLTAWIHSVSTIAISDGGSHSLQTLLWINDRFFGYYTRSLKAENVFKQWKWTMDTTLLSSQKAKGNGNPNSNQQYQLLSVLYLPHFYLWHWWELYQLQQDISLFPNDLFQLPHVRESSDGEKTTNVGQKSTGFMGRLVWYCGMTSQICDGF